MEGASGNYTEVSSVLQAHFSMSTSEATFEPHPSRPKRADALRNHERLIAAARDAFAEGGAATSLEEIARRAEVGIGTLYRNFPTRQDLLEAVYLDELDGLCRSAADLAELPPWEALNGWLHRFVGYLATKRALADELFAYMARDAAFFTNCRAAIFQAGEPLFERAQEAGVVRADAAFDDAIQIVMGIAKASGADAERTDRILNLALDGLRHQAPRVA
jgi:AcrR family transcriptional regulator